MLDYYKALEQLLAELPAEGITQSFEIPLLQAIDCILAEDIVAKYHSPRFDNSAMDGYVLGEGIDTLSHWQVVERIVAGDSGTLLQLTRGQAARIFTGAPIPNGGLAVVPQEDVLKTEDNNTFQVFTKINNQQNIRKKGSEFRAGEILLKKGQKLTPARIALAANQGYSQLSVKQPIHLTVFSTGNELVEPGNTLQEGKIYDVNRYLLLSWLDKLGYCQILDGGILPDNQEIIENALEKAAHTSQVIITSGGASVGEEDYLCRAVQKKGKLTQWKLAIKPGKPFAWGEIGLSKIFILPGNCAASLVTFRQLVLPLLNQLVGVVTEKNLSGPLVVKSRFSKEKSQIRREFLWVKLEVEDGSLWADLLPLQGSGMLKSCVQADAIAEIFPGATVKKGDSLNVYPLFF